MIARCSLSGKALVNRDQRLDHIAIDTAILIKEQRPRIAKCRSTLNADVQGAREAEVLGVSTARRRHLKAQSHAASQARASAEPLSTITTAPTCWEMSSAA
jgi:membrane carboxypeptidase/penicillin-binding protein PbpC